MLRRAKAHREIGSLISSHIDGGNLAPDDLVVQIVLDRIAQPDCRSGYLFDGFPRTVVQAEMLDQHLLSRGEALDVVIHLVADRQALVDRLLARAAIEHRVDDTPKTITARLSVYQHCTEPVLNHYRQQGLVRPVDAMGDPDEVFRGIVAALQP
jgi:adenylate kinase